MKCCFTLSGNDSKYLEMAKVLVLSARVNTDLDMYCIYDGEDEGFVDFLHRQNVHVLLWTISFLDELKMNYQGERSIQFCRGTYMCMELPKVLHEYGVLDEYILYVDTDIMFLGSIELDSLKPNYFSSSSDWGQNDWSRFSTGVMVMSIPNLLNMYPSFLAHLKGHHFNFPNTEMGPCDQGAWNTFYVNGEHERLDPIYDWKPWWGINENARIVHFSGPKPQQVKNLLELDKPTNEQEQLQKFVVGENPEAYKHYVSIWDGYVM